MAVHCLYLDFFDFLERMDEAKDRWESFKSAYFGKHREVLSTLWFDCQTYSRENIRERVRAIKRGDYAELINALEHYDLPGNTEAILDRCVRLAGEYTPGQAKPGEGETGRFSFGDALPARSAFDVFLFIGFFSPDAFVVRLGGRPALCVGLERFRTFRNYHLLLAHEYCHLLMMQEKGDTARRAVDRAVREGIAAYFSRFVYPGEGEHAYLFMEERTYRELLARYADTAEVIEDLVRFDAEGKDLFHGHGGGSHPRLGYFFGSLLVREYVEKTGRRDPRELIGRYEDIFVDFGLA